MAHFVYAKKEDIISTNTAHISSSEKYLRIEISRLIMIAHTHVRILPNHMTYSIS